MNYSFILTEKCNWSCEYCPFPHLPYPTHTTDDILRIHLPYIKKLIDEDNDIGYIDIQGGEIGLLPLFTLQTFLNNLNRKVIVCTNGLFIENNMYLDTQIRPFIQLLQWHICDLPNDKRIRDHNDTIAISRGIVHDDVDEIHRFIKRNTHIHFDYVDLEYDIINQRKVDVSEYQKLYHALENLPNVSKQNMERIKERLSEREGLRQFCYEYNKTVVINLVSEEICLCQRGIESAIPLTEKNLIDRIAKHPKELFENSMGCRSCTRLYAGGRTAGYKDYANVDQFYCRKFDTDIEGLYTHPHFQERNEVIIKILKGISPKSIFEFASTYGFLAKEILNQMDVEYLCTNFMPDVVDYTKNQGIPTEVFDARDIPKSDLSKYDTFICTSLEHLKDDLMILKSLPEGSHFIFSVPNFDDANHFRTFDNEVKIISRYKELLSIKKMERVSFNDRIKFVVYGVIK